MLFSCNLYSNESTAVSHQLFKSHLKISQFQTDVRRVGADSERLQVKVKAIQPLQQRFPRGVIVFSHTCQVFCALHRGGRFLP
jgi:hypothetical protein